MLKHAKTDPQYGASPCLETRELPAVFLRLQSPREQVALPYSSLIKLALALDGTEVELSYVTHRVTLMGRNLDEIYEAVANAEARWVAVAPEDFAGEASATSHMALVREIRIEPLDAEERRRR